jgi:hypothetical protein
MKKVIARSPAEIKVVLLQAAQTCVDWNTFIRYGENSGWVEFPDKIVKLYKDRTRRKNERENLIGRNKLIGKNQQKNFVAFMERQTIQKWNAI